MTNAQIDASRAAQAGGEIEITPEMIKAGRHVLWESGALYNSAPGSDDLLIADVFRAMVVASREDS